MKVAFPTHTPGGIDSRINPHFGKCEAVTIVTIDENDGSIINSDIIQPQGNHSCGQLPTIFANHGVEMCVVGGIGGRPFMMLQQLGIKTYRADSMLINLPIKDIISHLTSQQLIELQNSSCDQ